MTFHIPDLASYAEVAAAEMRAAKGAGLYQSNWRAQAVGRSRLTVSNEPNLATVRRSIQHRAAILRTIAAHTRNVDVICSLTGKSGDSVRRGLRGLCQEGMATRIGRSSAPRYSITPAGTAWLQAQEGEA